MSLLLNMPRDMTIKFSGDYLTHPQIPHHTECDADGRAVMVDNPLTRFSGQEMKLFKGINTVIDELAFYPPLRRFIVDPESAVAQPKAPAAPAVATEQSPTALAVQRANVAA